MCRFIAIPVGQGDAFYLETKCGSVLVDGGGSKGRFKSLFQKYTGQNKVNVLIATHNDADHTNGILGFLRAGLMCDEVWLPARWAQILPLILRPLEEVINILLEQVIQIQIERIYTNALQNKSKVLLLEKYGEFVHSKGQIDNIEESELRFNELGMPYNLLEWGPKNIEKLYNESRLLSHRIWSLKNIYNKIKRWNFGWPNKYYFSQCVLYLLKEFLLRARSFELFMELDEPRFNLFLEALENANRIREIALEAYHRRLPIKWFEWNVVAPYGGYPWLKPLNSREIIQIKPAPKEMLLEFLALTKVNKESLVFWVPSDYAGKGVLFTADSDLNNVDLNNVDRIKLYDGTIVTASHHGSEANKYVYKKITKQIIWVRSDRRAKNRPCKEYLNAPGKRYCTICRHGYVNFSDRQPVIFYEQNGEWIVDGKVRPCTCK